MLLNLLQRVVRYKRGVVPSLCSNIKSQGEREARQGPVRSEIRSAKRIRDDPEIVIYKKEQKNQLDRAVQMDSEFQDQANEGDEGFADNMQGVYRPTWYAVGQ